MAHEQSETVQRKDGKWINVYGRATGKFPNPLTPENDFEKEAYDTEPEASSAARRRSEEHGRRAMAEERKTVSLNSLSPEDRAYVLRVMQANKGASMQDAIEAVLEDNARRASAGTPEPAGVSEPAPAGQSLAQRVQGGMQSLREDFKERFGLSLPTPFGDPLAFLTDMFNPFPASLGDLGAMAGLGAAGAATRGAAGVVPSLVRTGSAVAGGAAGDYAAGEEMGLPALLRTLTVGGTEAASGARGIVKRFTAKGRLEPDDVARTADAVTQATRGVRPVQPTTEDLVRAGEGKPSMGRPGTSRSLEAALDEEFKRVLSFATGVTGQRVNFRLPDGQQGTLRQALDAYANLRAEGAVQGIVRPGAGDARAQAEQLWDHIVGHLRGQGGDLAVVAGALQQARANHATGMSVARLLNEAKSGKNPTVNERGRFSAENAQKRLHELAEGGELDPAIRDRLELALKRGYSGPATDTPGEIKLPFLRFSGHGVTAGEGLGNLVRMRLPTYVGNAPQAAPVAGLDRVLLDLGALIGVQNLRERTGLGKAPTP